MMECPTCSHTMQGIGYGMSHCPRCGTLAGVYADGAVTVPALVTRCRKFMSELRTYRLGESIAAAVVEEWRRLGVAEAINRPSDRH